MIHHRFISPKDSPCKECRYQCFRQTNLPQFYHHLCLGDPRRPSRRTYVRCSTRRPQVGDGWLCGSHGSLLVPLLQGQHGSFQHCIERNGVFLPEHVQRRSVWVDARGLSCANQGHRGWTSELLGPSIQYHQPLDCSAPVGDQRQRSPVPSWSRGFHQCHCHHAGTCDKYGRAELLKVGMGVHWVSCGLV